jgi:hypothetical protein
VISPTTTREALYVAATRGRESNRLYVDTHWDPDPHTAHDGTNPTPTPKEVLVGVLRNEGADLAAHHMIRRSQADAESIARLAAEYQTIAQAAQAERWDTLLNRSGLTPAQATSVRASPANGPLLAAFRDAEARGLDIDTALPLLVTGRTLLGVDDVASVLHCRVARWTEAADSRRPLGSSGLIVGLIPKAQNVTDPDMQQSLTQREDAIAERAWTVTEQAIESSQPWLRDLGIPPSDSGRRLAWLREACTVAAYRDRWNIDGPAVRPAEANTIEKLGHQRRAQAATDRARAISRTQPQVLGLDAASRPVRMENGVEM